MSEKKHYSQLINRLRLANFATNGFETCSNYSRPETSPDTDWNWQLDNIKPINFFIGPNNSGKSRLLRFLLISDLGDIDSDALPIWDIVDGLVKKEFRTKLSSKVSDHYVQQIGIPLQQLLYKEEQARMSYIEFNKILSNRSADIYANLQRYALGPGLVRQFVDCLISLVDSSMLSFLQKYRYNSFRKTYIPLLRGLRTLATNDVYLDRTLEDYFSNKGFKPNNGANEDNQLNIFTGHTLYEDLKKALLGDHQQRQSVKDYENFLSKYFFDDEVIALVPRIIVDEQTKIENNVVHIKIGKRQERAIYDLGDGLQTIIMLTVQAFLTEEPTIFFIEEPEQNVHAGLQRSIIEAFRLRPQHMYFMTTHSNHFVDLAQEYDDVGLQQVYQKVDGSEETTVVESSDAKLELLDSLGVRASSVLTANCSIWVEGVTDKLYLRAYLEKYLTELENSESQIKIDRAEKLRHYKENLHYLFTEYQGSNITHWLFGETDEEPSEGTPARKLNSKIFLLADGDIKHRSDRVDILERDLGDKFHLLDWKEIENYIPDNVLVKTAETRWETFQERHPFKFNSDNLMKKPGLFQEADKGVGEVLERYVRYKNNSPKKKGDKKFFAAKSGTIKDKVKFCNAAVEIMNDKNFEWSLTQELRDLCNAIWTHIENSN